MLVYCWRNAVIRRHFLDFRCRLVYFRWRVGTSQQWFSKEKIVVYPPRGETRDHGMNWELMKAGVYPRWRGEHFGMGTLQKAAPVYLAGAGNTKYIRRRPACLVLLSRRRGNTLKRISLFINYFYQQSHILSP